MFKEFFDFLFLIIIIFLGIKFYNYYLLFSLYIKVRGCIFKSIYILYY